MSLNDEVQRTIELCVSDVTKRFKDLIGDEEMSKEDTVAAFTLFMSRLSAVIVGSLMEKGTELDKLRDILLPYLENFRDALVNEGYPVNLAAVVCPIGDGGVDEQEEFGLDRVLDAIPWEKIKTGGYPN